jgi:DNA replicative helicase MCM subunit Mcm2 (Cdc46/Mcm family)
VNLQFKKTGGADFPDHLKVLLTGDPKTGKTSLLGTVPNILILDTEPHANNLQSVAHLNLPYATINSTQDLEQAKLFLQDPAMRQMMAESLGMEKIEAVAIDTLDTLQAIYDGSDEAKAQILAYFHNQLVDWDDVHARRPELQSGITERQAKRAEEAAAKAAAAAAQQTATTAAASEIDEAASAYAAVAADEELPA